MTLWQWVRFILGVVLAVSTLVVVVLLFLPPSPRRRRLMRRAFACYLGSAGLLIAGWW